MKIAEYTYVLIKSLAIHEALLEIIDFGMQDLTRITPSTIKINSSYRRSSVAYDHTVGVDHRNKFDDIVV